MSPSPMPTVRSLAAELRVSPITVSRALRGFANVRPALVERIQQHARKRGYRPDPVLADVLGGLGRRAGVRYRETVAFVWTHPLSYPELEERGVKATASALGYRVDVIKPWTMGSGKADISRMLWSRGIRGVLLAPNHSRPDPRYDLEWFRFCAVLLGSSLVNTGLTRVSRDYYHDTTLALDELRKHGCRRPGVVLEANFYERSGRRCVAALLAFGGSRKHTHVVKVRDAANRDAVIRWYRQTKPDGVLVADPQIAGWLSNGPMLAVLNQPGETAGTGVQVDFEQIGTEGMHALDALLRTDRRGLIPNPTNILVPGRWIENGRLSDL